MVWIILTVCLLLAAVKTIAVWIERTSLYHPIRGITETPNSIRVSYEDLRLKTRDGQSLNAWHVPFPGSKQAVLFCHGNAGNMSGRLHRVAFFHALGVHLMLFDYRGYGLSTGRPYERGLYRDVEAAYDYLVEEKGIAPDQIMVYGKSLGCAVAVDLAKQCPVGCLVMESPFASVREVVKDIKIFEPFAGLTSQKFDSLKKIAHIKAPKWIVHGRYDDVVGFRHAALLHAAALPPKVLLPYDGGHNDMDYVTSRDYAKKIGDIFRGMEK